MTSTTEYALMAANSYGTSREVRSTENTVPQPTPWEIVNFADLTTGFLGRAYRGPSGEIVIAYGGTTYEDGFPWADWTEGNIPGASGLVNAAPQVIDAARFYLDVARSHPDATKITFTGHSLGGGLAALMAVFFNREAVVFDPAPFSRSADSQAVVEHLRSALTDYGEDFRAYEPGIVVTNLGTLRPSPTRLLREGNVTAYRVEGEVLAALDPFMGIATADAKPIGRIMPSIDPRARSSLEWFGIMQAVDLHSMDLLAAFLREPTLVYASRGQPSFMEQLFKAPFQKINPTLPDRVFLPLMIQRDVAGEHALTVLAEDIQNVKTSGLTGIDAVQKALVLATLAGHYAQGLDRVNSDNQDLEFESYMKAVEGGVSFDLGKLRPEEHELVFPKLRDYLQFTNYDGGVNAPVLIDVDDKTVWFLQTGKAAIQATSAGETNDVMVGWTTGDHLDGGAGDDLLIGDAGADMLIGGAGEDTLVGGSGHDVLIGGEGNDNLWGGIGADWLWGGPGDDELRGGPGDDIYVLEPGDAGADILIDTLGNNKIFFDGRPVTLGIRNGEVWISPDGRLTLTRNSRLTISDETGASIVVADWQQGDFGVRLEDAPGSPTEVVYGDEDPDYLLAGDRLIGVPNVNVGYHWIGGQGADVINPKSLGDDIIEGNQGSDLLFGSNGDDQIFGGDRSELAVFIEEGRAAEGLKERGDWVSGGLGQDIVVGSHARDVVLGGGGRDVLVGGAGDDLIDGDDNYFPTDQPIGRGPDGIEVRMGGAIYEWELDLSDPLDPVFLSVESYAYAWEVGDGDVVYAGAGNDIVLGLMGDDVLMGEEGDDVMRGDDGADTLLGGPGNDRLYGESAGRLHGDGLPVQFPGDDYLDGGDGNDELVGEEGGDTLFGGAGNDVLIGDGSHVREALHGNDYLDGGEGDDYLRGFGGDDHLLGGDGDDVLLGDAGNDVLEGGDGADQLIGGAGDDVISGGDQNDYLDGGAGDDEILGGAGADVLSGGIGDDVLVGGAGSDTYILDWGMENDVIEDSGAEGNVLRLQAGVGFDELAGTRIGDDLRLRLRHSGEGVLIRDFFLAPQAWRVEAGEGGSRAIEDFIGWKPVTASPTSADAAREAFKAELTTAYQAAVLSSGFQRSGAGTFDLLTGYTSGDYSVTNHTVNSFLISPRRAGAAEVQTGTDYSFLLASYSREGSLIPPATVVVRETYEYRETVTIEELFASTLDDAISVAGNGIVDAGSGNDIIDAAGWSDSPYSLSSGRDGGILGAFLYGNEGDDRVSGSDGDDVVAGGAGNDALDGRGGADRYVYFAGEAGSDAVLDTGGIDQSAYQAWYYQQQGISDWEQRLEFGDRYNFYAAEIFGGYFATIEEGITVLEGRGLSLDAFQAAGGTIRYVEALDTLAPTVAANDYAAMAPLYVAGLIERDTIQLPIDVTLERLSLSWTETLGSGVITPYAALRVSWGTGSVDVLIPHSDDLLGTGIENFMLADGGSVALGEMIAMAPPPPTFDPHQLDNVIEGSDADEAIWGAGGNDELTGGGGLDSLAGGMGNDVLRGGAGGDWLGDTEGRNVLEGGAEDDQIRAGGASLVAGGTGSDRIVLCGPNAILAFNAGDGRDTVDLWSGSGEPFAISLGGGLSVEDLTLVREGYDVVLEFGGDDSIRLSGYWERTGATILLQEIGVTVRTYDLSAALAPLAGLGGAEPRDAYWRQAADFGGHLVNEVADRALGGAIAYAYATTGSTEALPVEVIRELLASSDFGVAPQPIADRPPAVIAGTAGADSLTGTALADTLAGGPGIDTLAGGAGSDTYLFNLGDGVDSIIDSASASEPNAVVFGAGITPEMLSLALGSLLLRVGSGGDAIHLDPFDPADPFGPHPVDEFWFADGTVLSYGQLLARGFDIGGTGGADTLVGTALNDRMLGLGGDDILEGGRGDDVLDGGTGDDLLSGGAGNDTYRFGPGAGHDRIQELESGGTDRLLLDALPGAVVVTRFEADLNITLMDGGDTVSIIGASGIEATEFADGTVWDAATLMERVNGPPTVAKPIGIVSVIADDPFSFAVPKETFFDPDSWDDLKYSASLADGSGLPAWLSFDPVALRFKGTADDPLGAHELRITATDRAGASASDVLALRVAAAPVRELRGGWWNDTLEGGDERDHLSGLAGNDLLYGGGGSDFLEGGWHADLLDGGEGRDVLDGGDAGDVLRGGEGNDLLFGGMGDDTLVGGAGADFLAGGKGNDTLLAGPGDVIAFRAGDGRDSLRFEGDGSATLSLSGVEPGSLKLRRRGNDLELTVTGAPKRQPLWRNWFRSLLHLDSGGDRLVLKDWYAAAQPPVSRLQLIGESIETYDFAKAVARYDAAQHPRWPLSDWSLADALMDAHLASSGEEALGGGLAARYAAGGALAGFTINAAQAVLADGRFGAEAQALAPPAGLQEGYLRLS